MSQNFYIIQFAYTYIVYQQGFYVKTMQTKIKKFVYFTCHI